MEATSYPDTARGCGVRELYMQQDRGPEALEKFRLVASLPVLVASDTRTQRSAVGLIQDLKQKSQ